MKPVNLFLVFCSLLFSTVVLADIPKPEESANWPLIKKSLFGENADIIEDDFVQLVTPKRAEDAALVPVIVKIPVLQTSSSKIKRIILVVDNNPSPIVGTFTMSDLNGLADISTRIRVNVYSHVRAIAETQDGKLHMKTNYVKASGGCSAPANGDDEALRKRMGKMKLRDQLKDDKRQLNLLISHPNYSGLQIDQVSRHWIQADYVDRVDVTLDDKPVLSFEGGISISENPSFSFYLKGDLNGELVVNAHDSQQREFESSWTIK